MAMLAEASTLVKRLDSILDAGIGSADGRRVELARAALADYREAQTHHAVPDGVNPHVS